MTILSINYTFLNLETKNLNVRSTTKTVKYIKNKKKRLFRARCLFEQAVYLDKQLFCYMH